MICDTLRRRSLRTCFEKQISMEITNETLHVSSSFKWFKQPSLFLNFYGSKFELPMKKTMVLINKSTTSPWAWGDFCCVTEAPSQPSSFTAMPGPPRWGFQGAKKMWGKKTSSTWEKWVMKFSTKLGKSSCCLVFMTFLQFGGTFGSPPNFLLGYHYFG